MMDRRVHTIAAMGTVVSIEVVGSCATRAQRSARDDAIARAVGWFEDVEATCSRFIPESELHRLSRQVGVPVPVSPMLLEAVRVALAVAVETNGAFDPTIGARMERRGFNQAYRTGEIIHTASVTETNATFRDIAIDRDAQTITLHRPLLLDLGAVAKGMAVDLAARELQPFDDFVIDAGGDVYCAGHNAAGTPWSIGIRHPRASGLIETLSVSNAAVCTSGDYERTTGAGHHIVDPQTDEPARQCASVTVIAPVAIIADALATAAFVLGPAAGLALLERHTVEGLLFTPALERHATPGVNALSSLTPVDRHVDRQPQTLFQNS